jgi:muramoyltetrapeptide carboxypeptidase
VLFRSAPARLPGAWQVPGRASGRLVGGNLSLVAALCGTPWQLRTAGALLFLEEVGESAYRIDRSLVQLRQAGLLQAAAGFVLGSFTDGDDATPVLQAHLGGLGKPVLAGWPTGHGTPHQPLPLGVAMALDAGAATLQLAQDFLVTDRR